MRKKATSRKPTNHQDHSETKPVTTMKKTTERTTMGSTTNLSNIALVTFGKNGAPKISGRIVTGSHIKVNYDFHRLLDNHPECIRRTPNGDIGEIQMGVRINGDDRRVNYYKFVAGFSTAKHYSIPIQDTVKIPEDAKKVEVWFSTGGPLYNYAYDSNYSKNYCWEVE